MLLRPVLVALLLALPAAAAAQPKGGQPKSAPVALPDCPGTIPAAGTRLACRCPAGFAMGSVWGSGPYTADSDICTAARHAGLVGPDGGNVQVERAPGRDRYDPSARNGVSTSEWGPYDESIVLTGGDGGGGRTMTDVGPCTSVPDGAEPVICTCGAPALRSVWGSGPYTADSDICTAALHAGAMGAGGGRITLLRLPGQDSYPGSDANGVRTSDWGQYGESFDVARAGEMPDSGGQATRIPTAPAAPVEVGACGVLPDTVDRLTCSCGRGLARGEVWGSGPYTADSDICTAARHAGIVRSFGGDVKVLRVPGLAAYSGSAGNGVSTLDWREPYDSSIVFDRN